MRLLQLSCPVTPTAVAGFSTQVPTEDVLTSDSPTTARPQTPDPKELAGALGGALTNALVLVRNAVLMELMVAVNPVMAEPVPRGNSTCAGTSCPPTVPTML